MSDAWATAVAALGASALTLFGTYGLERFREGRAGKDAHEDRRRALYIELLSITGTMMTNYASLRAITSGTSGWLHSLRQLLKNSLAQPTIMEVLALFRDPFERLMKAWSDAYLIFDQDEIDAVNRLVEQIQALDVSVEQADPASAENSIGAARREFAKFARGKLGESIVTFDSASGGNASKP